MYSNTQDYKDNYTKLTNFILMDASSRYIPFDKVDITEHKLIYLNKNAQVGDTAFAFYTLNNSIQIVKQENRFLLKFYNCNHSQPGKLAGVGFTKLEHDPDGFQYEHYYESLMDAVKDSIHEIIEDEQNLSIYGYFDTQYCNDEFIADNTNDNLIKAARLNRLYFSRKTTLFQY